MRISILLLFSLLSTITFAQNNHEKCGAQLIFDSQYQNNPHQYDALEQSVQQYIAKNKSKLSKSGETIIVIPVVFHVVYNPSQNGSNLSEAILKEQIKILNEDFRRLNKDTTQTREIFKPIAADIQIEFRLANVDPSGLPTTGITRTESYKNFNVFAFENDVKYTSKGGHDAWPAGSYLNLWTCDMSLIAAQYVIGYAQFPGGNPATDGVVVQWQYVGRNTGASGNFGRTATHEVGHWLGLRHIWGDGDCSASDFVDDTPNAAASNSSCSLINSCSNEDPFWAGVNPPDMVENYMDYSGDDCMNTFTIGQKSRMMGFLNTDSLRLSLFKSKGYLSNTTGITTYAQSGFNIYPNPASNYVKILSDQVVTAVQLTDLTGKKLTTNYLSGNSVDVSHLEVGCYFLSVSFKDGTVGQTRFIKH